MVAVLLISVASVAVDDPLSVELPVCRPRSVQYYVIIL